MHERATLAFGLQIRVKITLRELLDEARESGAAEDPVIRDRLAQLYIESEVLRLNALRGLSAIMRTGVPGPEGSLGKWQWADVNQALTELALELRGGRAVSTTTAGRYRFLRARANSIEGGTTEILKTSSPSACSACRGCDEVRAHRRPAGDPAHRARVPRQPLPGRGGRCLALEDERGFTDDQWARSPSSAGRRSWCPRTTAGSGSASSSSRAAGAARLRARADAAALDGRGRARDLRRRAREQRAEWLPGLAEGERRGTIAQLLLAAVQGGDAGDGLTGTLEAVPDAAGADLLVVPTGHERLAVVDLRGAA